jgi:hypothetical protein
MPIYENDLGAQGSRNEIVWQFGIILFRSGLLNVGPSDNVIMKQRATN